MEQIKNQILSLIGSKTFVDVFFVVHKRNYVELEGKYLDLPKDLFLYYWEVQIISDNNLLKDLPPLRVKDGKHGTIGGFLSYCNTPPKSEEIAINTLKKLMLCSYLANIEGVEKVYELLKKENTDNVCKRIEKQISNLEFKLSPIEPAKQKVLT